MVGGAALHGRSKVTQEGRVRRAEKRGKTRARGRGEKEWMDCVAQNRPMFDIKGDWSTAAQDPGAWYNIVCERGCRFMAAWVREEEQASENQQRMRETEEADKVEVAPGVTVGSLRRFRAALIGPTQGFMERRRLH